MTLFRLSLLLMLIFGLAACGQQEQGTQTGNNGSDNQEASPENRGGIVAGKLEATIQVEGHQAMFQIKNQTEKVKELIIPGKTAYEYMIVDEEGKTVFERAQGKPQYEKKHAMTLKQAETIEYKLKIPENLQPGTYHLTAVLHTKPVLKAKTKFTIEK